MANIDFTYFYKQKYSNIYEIKCLDYDILISTFNTTERVCKVFEAISANEKYLIVLPEHMNLFNSSVMPLDAQQIHLPSYSDYISLIQFLETLQLDENKKLCIDITGFIIPHILFTIKYLQKRKHIRKLELLYTEPQKYINEENTNFTDYFHNVVQIIGYGGSPNPNSENDLLIIASGYDDSRITDVADKKRRVNNKIQLFGFPSMQADMFQENILKAYKAEVSSEWYKNLDNNLFAPANDPFVAAQTIKEYIDKEKHNNKNFSNIYLAPISTKPHALGMALYYLWENSKEDQPISIIYPVCDKYFGDTTEGISKIWKYDVELP